VAARMSWYLGAMLAAIALAWLAVEVGLLRRVTALTRRAAAVSYTVQDGHIGPRLGDLEVADLRGSDELGILAGGLADLLQRVKDDLARERLRAQQERDMWHAVGHEIMSPLQSLMVLHGAADDPGHRYVQRMQQAVHVLYGTASPAEALQAADVPQGRLDLDAFLRHVADNAHFAGISNVVYEGEGGPGPVIVRADEFALEDVVTHILRNADRYRPAGSAITLTLAASESTASATLHNLGSTIEEDLLERIFELGVSDPSLPTPLGESDHRGQGLFVAKTYMAKMGGTVNARNTADGVAFTLTFQRLG
jgi:two-component system OmpR family sensor kinase